MKGYLLSFFVFFAALVAVPVLYPLFLGEEANGFCIKLEDGTLDSEEYVALVVAAQLEGYDAETAVYEAMAVAVRSCVFCVKKNGGNHSDFDFCTKSGCCFETAADTKSDSFEKAKLACESTKGILLLYKASPAMALWHKSSGKKTADCTEFLYLVSVDNTDESGFDNFRYTKSFDYKEISQLLDIPLASADDAKKMCVLYSDDGRAQWCVFEKKTICGTALKQKLMLPSQEIRLTFDDSAITAECVGNGSGYGMSINGATVLAREGKCFEEILNFYYPLLTVSKNLA